MPKRLGFVEKRLGGRSRHLRLEPGIDLGLILGVPAWEEGRQCQFREHDQLALAGRRFPEEGQQPFDDVLPAFFPSNRPELRGGDLHGAGHALVPFWPSRPSWPSWPP